MIFPFFLLANYGATFLTMIFSTNIDVLLFLEGLPANFSASDIIYLQYVLCFLIVHLCMAVFIKLISKTNFWHKLRTFGYYSKMCIPIGIFYFLFYIFFGAYSSASMSNAWFLATTVLPYIALLVLVVLMVSDIKRTENLKSAQELLAQQQNYIDKLETLQGEIRGIQHDYKNLLAGLYAQASEGDADAVKRNIETNLLRVDESVSRDLRQTNQLAQIEIPELKGLVLSKILEAERDQIPFVLEVLSPVRHTAMAIEDLLRCVGILLDNAIESARELRDAAITLVLLVEDSRLTVIVKNLVIDKPDMSQIYGEGYSTKGAGRGIGLANYRKIVRKYSGATQETKIENGQFVQTLVLSQQGNVK